MFGGEGPNIDLAPGAIHSRQIDTHHYSPLISMFTGKTCVTDLCKWTISDWIDSFYKKKTKNKNKNKNKEKIKEKKIMPISNNK